MIEHRHYIAKPGVVIRDPRSKARVPHAAPGIYVERSSFWVRRENDGDVIDITAQVSGKPELAKRKSATTEG